MSRKKKVELLILKTVFVIDVPKEGAAYAAGIKKGDVITRINEIPVTTGAEMVGQIATYRPGDKINISYKRGGKNIKPI